MVINTKNLLYENEYDLDRELEMVAEEGCLGEWFYTSYQWARLKRQREKVLNEIKINLSESVVELQK